MSATWEKLQEARYFLKRMNEEQADRAAFKYNLSAFLSAARSVTFYMQKEFKHMPGFEEWYAMEQEAMRRDPLMSFFVEARNVTLKQQYVPTNAQVDVAMTATSTGSVNIGMVIIREDETEQRIDSEKPVPEGLAEPTSSEPAIEWKWLFKDPPRGAEVKDVVAICAEYVSTLGAIVDRCEAEFSS